MKIIRLKEIDSTNTECFRRFDSGLVDEEFIMIAESQTNGRGQFDRVWYSADTENLYISFGFFPKCSPEKFKNFSTVLAFQMKEHFNTMLNLKLEVKLPNDIYYSGKKLGGILTESKIVDGKIAFAVTGIGLNVAGDIKKFPEQLQQTATTLSLVYGKNLDKNVIETEVIKVVQDLILKIT